MKQLSNQFQKSFSTLNYPLIGLILLAISALAQLNNITITTMDDFKTLMNTFGSPLKGAIDQGRFQFLYQLPIARFPYFFGNLIVVQIIRGLSHVALLAVVCYFIYRVTKSAKIGLLIFVLFFSWMQNSLGTYSLVTSYVFSFHLSLISIFLAFIIFEKYSMNPTAKGGFLIAALTFYGISAYESYLFFLALTPFIDQSKVKTLKSRAVLYLPFFMSIVLYLITTIIWRTLFPSYYEGNLMKMSLNDLPLAILVTVQFTIAALPGYFFYLQKLYNLDILELLRVVSPLTFLQSLIAFLISALVLFKLEKDSLIKNRKIMILSIVSVILAFAMNSMYGLTSKYREWVMLGQPAYVGTFFSSLLFTIFFAILFCQLLDIVSERFNFLLRIVSVLVFALGISLITVLIGISNQQVSAQQSEMSSKLQLIDLFINSDLYKTLNEMDVIVGPVLFKGPPGFSDYDWSDYLKYKTGKEINLVKSISDKKVFNRRFNLDIVKVGSDNLNNILVVYDVLPMNLSNNLYIFSGKKGVINITGKYKPSGKGIFKVTSDNLIRYSFNKEIFSAEVSGNNIKILTSEPFEIYSVQVNRNMTPTNFFQM